MLIKLLNNYNKIQKSVLLKTGVINSGYFSFSRLFLRDYCEFFTLNTQSIKYIQFVSSNHTQRKIFVPKMT